MTFLPFLIGRLSQQPLRPLLIEVTSGSTSQSFYSRFLPIRQDNTALKEHCSRMPLWPFGAPVGVAVTPLSSDNRSLFRYLSGGLWRSCQRGVALSYDTPIPWAAGEWWLAGNLAVYSKDNPRVLIHASQINFAVLAGDYMGTTTSPSAGVSALNPESNQRFRSTTSSRKQARADISQWPFNRR